MAGKQRPRRKGKGAGIGKGLGVATLVTVIGGGIYAARFEPVAPPGTSVWGMDVSGKDRAEIEAMLDERWSAMSAKTVQFEHQGKPFGSRLKAADLGLTLDPIATLAKVPFQTALDSVGSMIAGGETERVEVSPELEIRSEALEPLAKLVRSSLGKQVPARVRMIGESIERRAEDAGSELDVEAMLDSVSAALRSGEPANLPLKRAEVKMTEAVLAEIDGEIGSFSTSFSEGNRPRSNNIRVAASTIDGTVLLPGDKFSFNGHLGRRTTAKGYQVAGVYVSGRHDIDVGGGICQVSTTLFNAALLSGLDFAARSPHSLPVPYVPRGRDAAVSYPQPDLVLQNDYGFPIALSASVSKGKITFRVLGPKAAKPKVHISQQTLSSWGRGVKYVEDKSLAPGREVVEDRGGSASRAVTSRTVTLAGGETRKHTFESVYSGGPRIVRRNSSPKPVAKPVEPATKPPAPPTAPADPPPVDPASASGGL